MKNWKLFCSVLVIAGVAIFFGHKTYRGHVAQQVEQVPGQGEAAQVAKDQAAHSDEAGQTADAQKGADGKSASVAGQSAGAAAGAAGAAQPQAVAEKPKPESNCFVYEFQHKPEAKQKDIEDFMDFSNAFPIAHKNFNPKSICVKVNQAPVAYKLIDNKGQPEVLLGSIVGPESLIRLTYCIGKANCKENCAQPQKRFMDDLVSDDSEDEFGESWGNSEDQKKKLKAHVKAFRSVAKENDSLTKQSVMRDWKTLNHQESVCTKEGK